MTPRASLAMMAAGIVLVVFGVVGGFVFADDDDDETSAPVSAVTTTTTAPTTTSVLPVDLETPEELYALLEAAIRDGDADVLFARLDPAVLDAYGEDQCRAYVETLDEPTIAFEVLGVGEPETWDFGERDGLAIPITEAIPVEIVQSVDGTAAPPQEAHVHRIGDELRWFTDCGDPV